MVLYHFAASYAAMYALALQHPTIFGKYPDWARLQILVLYSFCLDDPWTRDLIWLNAVGVLLSSHFLYTFSGYALLDSIGSDFFKKVLGYDHSGRILHLTADLLHQGAPALFACGVHMTELGPRAPVPQYLWLVTAIPHAVYGYLLTGQWGLKTLYGPTIGPWPKNWVIVACVMSGHFAAFLFI